jgi:prepilin-type processing-associated H-X9-DG protein
MAAARRFLLFICTALALCLTSSTLANKLGHGIDKFGKPYIDATLSKEQEKAPKHPHYAEQSFQLPPFYAISATGNVNLFVHGKKPYQKVSLTGYLGALKAGNRYNTRPVIWVDHGVLYIDNEDWLRDGETMEITIDTNYLNALFLDGHINVYGDHIRSTGMVIDDNSSGDVHLDGKMVLNWLNARGSGNIYVSWVDSPLLLMSGTGSGIVRLSGVADQMRVRLFNHMRYAGQYLRVKNLMISTEQMAAANVFAINTMEAFAYDFSNIYYFHTPHSLNRLTRESGNVLQADWRL